MIYICGPMGDRRGFLKQIGLGLAGVSLAPDLSHGEREHLLREEIKRSLKDIGPLKVVVSTQPAFPYYDGELRAQRIQEELLKIENGNSSLEVLCGDVRWMFNRLDDYSFKSVRKFSVSRAHELIEEASNRLSTCYVVTSENCICACTVFITHAQSLLQQSRSGMIAEVLRRIEPFYQDGRISDSTNLNLNLYSWAANICDEAQLTEDAFHFATLDQSLRTNGTRSKLLMKLTKFRKHGQA